MKEADERTRRKSGRAAGRKAMPRRGRFGTAGLAALSGGSGDGPDEGRLPR